MVDGRRKACSSVVDFHSVSAVRSPWSSRQASIQRVRYLLGETGRSSLPARQLPNCLPESLDSTLTSYPMSTLVP